MRLTAEDHALVTAAAAAAEAQTAGEIVTIVARRSDEYREVAAHGGLVAMLAMLAAIAAWPAIAERAALLVHDPWAGPVPAGALLAAALVLATLAFLAGRVALSSPRARIALTPAATRTRRVRAHAYELFRIAAEKKTAGATGVLIYLSLEEHRAELIADAGIHGRVPPETWGAAMGALVAALKDGRPGEGMAEAVRQVGIVLAQHFPRSEDDVNELPDRLIEL